MFDRSEPEHALSVAIDAVGIRDGGGESILKELLIWLPRVRSRWMFTVFVLSDYVQHWRQMTVSDRIRIEGIEGADTGLGRLWWVSARVGRSVRRCSPGVLLAFANIGSLRSETPQVVYCHQFLAFDRGGRSKIPLLARVRQHVLRRAIITGARASSAVVVQTAAMANALTSEAPELDGKIVIIPGGVRSDFDAQTIRSEVAERIDSCSHPRLVYVCNVAAYKNYQLLLDTLPQLARSFPNVRLLLTLDPPYQSHIGMARNLMGRKAATDPGERVVWLGRLNSLEVSYLLKCSDLMVYPSYAESFGLPLVEAMAAGCPVIAADRAYAHEVCGTGASYFDPSDTSSLCACLTRTLSSGSELDRLRQTGLERSKRYEYSAIAESIASVLETAGTGRAGLDHGNRAIKFGS